MENVTSVTVVGARSGQDFPKEVNMADVLDMLDKEISILREEVDRLYHKTTPVRTDYPEVSDTNELKKTVADTAIPSYLATGIREAQEIHLIAMRLSSITSALAL